MVKKLLCRLIESIGADASSPRYIEAVSPDGSVTVNVRALLKSEEARRHLDAVAEIRKKYRGVPYVCDWP